MVERERVDCAYSLVLVVILVDVPQPPVDDLAIIAMPGAVVDLLEAHGPPVHHPHHIHLLRAHAVRTGGGSWGELGELRVRVQESREEDSGQILHLYWMNPK